VSGPLPILTVPEAAAFLRLCEKTIYRLIDGKKLRASKIANRWRIRRRDAEAYLRAAENMPEIDQDDLPPQGV
jgi:excisionase family DNA binding protein